MSLALRQPQERTQPAKRLSLYTVHSLRRHRAELHSFKRPEEPTSQQEPHSQNLSLSPKHVAILSTRGCSTWDKSLNQAKQCTKRELENAQCSAWCGAAVSDLEGRNSERSSESLSKVIRCGRPPILTQRAPCSQPSPHTTPLANGATGWAMEGRAAPRGLQPPSEPCHLSFAASDSRGPQCLCPFTASCLSRWDTTIPWAIRATSGYPCLPNHCLLQSTSIRGCPQLSAGERYWWHNNIA